MPPASVARRRQPSCPTDAAAVIAVPAPLPQVADAVVPAVVVEAVPAVVVVAAPAVITVAAPAVVVGLEADGRALGMFWRRRRGRRSTPGTKNGSTGHRQGGDGDRHALRKVTHRFSLRLRALVSATGAQITDAIRGAEFERSRTGRSASWASVDSVPRHRTRERCRCADTPRFHTTYGTLFIDTIRRMESRRVLQEETYLSLAMTATRRRKSGPGPADTPHGQGGPMPRPPWRR